MFNPYDIRKKFPILEQRVYNKPLVYLDNGATTQKPRSMVEQIEKGYYTLNANIHRGVHYLSQKATEAHEEARRRVGQFIGANNTKEVIFTRGTTESINLVAHSFCEAFMSEGDEIIVSAMEHHSNIVPWQMEAERRGLVLKVIPLTATDELDWDAFVKLLTPKTKMVAITHVSNVLGTINPVDKIIKEAHNAGAKVLIDGAQAVAHIPVNVITMDADFYVFSAHKIYGPNGIGVLYGKEELLNTMPPYQGGGEMIAKVTFEKTTYNELPFKFEAGTPDYIGSTALAKAMDFLTECGIEEVAKHEHELIVYATAQLNTIEGMRIIGNAPEKSGVISFLIGSIHPYDLGMLLDKLGFALRTGHHCAQPLMQTLGIEGTARLSVAMYNTKDEIDRLMVALHRVVKMLT